MAAPSKIKRRIEQLKRIEASPKESIITREMAGMTAGTLQWFLDGGHGPIPGMDEISMRSSQAAYWIGDDMIKSMEHILDVCIKYEG